MKIARWIFLLPGSLLGGWIAYLLMRLPFMLFASEDSWYNEIIAHGFFGFAGILCAYSIAPSHKRVVALLMTALALFLLGAGAVIMVVAARAKELPWFQAIRQLVGMIAGVIGAAAYILSAKKDPIKELLSSEGEVRSL